MHYEIREEIFLDDNDPIDIDESSDTESDAIACFDAFRKHEGKDATQQEKSFIRDQLRQGKGVEEVLQTFDISINREGVGAVAGYTAPMNKKPVRKQFARKITETLDSLFSRK